MFQSATPSHLRGLKHQQLFLLRHAGDLIRINKLRKERELKAGKLDFPSH